MFTCFLVYSFFFFVRPYLEAVLWTLVCESTDPLQASKSPKSGKEGFGVKKHPFPIVPEKDALNPKFHHFPCGTLPVEKLGFFGLKAPFSGATGNGSF